MKAKGWDPVRISLCKRRESRFRRARARGGGAARPPRRRARGCRACLVPRCGGAPRPQRPSGRTRRPAASWVLPRRGPVEARSERSSEAGSAGRAARPRAQVPGSSTSVIRPLRLSIAVGVATSSRCFRPWPSWPCVARPQVRSRGATPSSPWFHPPGKSQPSISTCRQNRKGFGYTKRLKVSGVDSLSFNSIRSAPPQRGESCRSRAKCFKGSVLRTSRVKLG